MGWGGRNWDSLVREAAETVAHAPQVMRNCVPPGTPPSVPGALGVGKNLPTGTGVMISISSW